MAALKTAHIRAALLRKGFREDLTHHRYLWLYVDNKKTSIKTRLSHGAKEYGDFLLSQVQKQLKLSRPELLRFVECPLDYEQYVRHLVGNGWVTRS